jgi:hypothetical protein
MEVDPSHPKLLREELLDSATVEFVDSYQDFCGRERFVQLKVK